MALGHTWHVKLTKGSDANTNYAFLLQEGADGQPAVRLGQTAKEAAQAGAYDTIRIESLHHGSGQYLARDPMMYEWADGMIADTPGQVRAGGGVTAGGAGKPSLVAETFAPWERTAIITDEADNLFVFPTKIYSGTTLKATAPANSHYTGSYAVFGSRLFFGCALSNGLSTNVTFRDTDGTYNTVGNFKASFLAAQVEKLFMAEQTNANSGVGIRWTDDISSNAPVATATYSGALGFIRDIAILGSHLVISLQRQRSVGSVVTMDITTAFTPLLDNIRIGTFFTPLLGGQMLWLAGTAGGLWMPDVGTYRSLSLEGALSIRQCDAAIPRIRSTSYPYVQVGAAADSQENEMLVALRAQNYTYRDGTVANGVVIVRAELTDEGLKAHTILGPETSGADLGTNQYVCGLAFAPASTANPHLENPRYSAFYTAALQGGVLSNCDVNVVRLDMWEDDKQPRSFQTDTPFLRTSRYEGRHWNTKYLTKLRGYARVISGSPTLTAKIFLDSSETAANTVTISANGLFSADLPAGLLGRLVAVEMAGTNCVFELPWEIDYFAVPSQQDIVRLGILVGKNQVRRTGGVSRKSRAQQLLQVQEIAASGVEWTLKWWDDGGMSDWTVMPISYETEEIEGQKGAGEGALVAWLTCLRTA